MTKVEKQNKFLFYIKGYSAKFLLRESLEKKISTLSKTLSKKDLDVAEYRVAYYNKLSGKHNFEKSGTKIKDLQNPKSPKSYYFDTYEYAKYFDPNLLIDFTFGDVDKILSFPMITKSRPIDGNNENNVLLNLDKARHFVKIVDPRDFESKSDKLIGRAAVHQQHRIDFFKIYFEHPICDLGQVNKKGGDSKWLKPKISIHEHLKNKFILSLEGNDVATNLKWIMCSNSLAISPKLKMETWYMEGTLIPNQHYVQIADDYSDLEERMQYYLDHPNEAKLIIDAAKEFRTKFNNKKLEDLISLLVLKKYFDIVV
ncbi:glycosyl transferase family 90 [Soonwooa sp.]|uniref:glycosyl transferase family 90 n=1 Tax=Soonwooa sp. TaxID=1938592 RepID=UPI0026257ED4|nr:glycosyl transferase family 90 [Soonwooa sp.]